MDCGIAKLNFLRGIYFSFAISITIVDFTINHRSIVVALINNQSTIPCRTLIDHYTNTRRSSITNAPIALGKHYNCKLCISIAIERRRPPNTKICVTETHPPPPTPGRDFIVPISIYRPIIEIKRPNDHFWSEFTICAMIVLVAFYDRIAARLANTTDRDYDERNAHTHTHS